MEGRLAGPIVSTPAQSARLRGYGRHSVWSSISVATGWSVGVASAFRSSFHRSVVITTRPLSAGPPDSVYYVGIVNMVCHIESLDGSNIIAVIMVAIA